MLASGQKSGESTIRNMYCSMEILITANIKSKIFNAAKFILHFDIPLKPGLDISQFNDEYLVLNQIPANAVRASIAYITIGEQKTAANLPTSTCIQKVAIIPPVHIPYFESFNLVNLPAKLFRVIYAGGKALYNHHDEGLTAHSQTHPRAWSDSDFKKSIQLQATGDDNLANRRFHIMFAAHSNRDSAFKRAENLHNGNKQLALAIAHIDTGKLGNSSSRWIYHAAYVIKELRIPLKEGQQISQFHHQYLILNRVPAEAILKIENLTPNIRPSVESKAMQQKVESSSPNYMYTGFAIVTPHWE